MTNGKAYLGGCFTTNEIISLAGISRKQLRSYTEKGIVAPLLPTSDEPSYGRRVWTIEQVALLRHVPALVRSGYSLEEIATLADQGAQAVTTALTAQYMRVMREGRRSLKDTVSRRRELLDIIAVGVQRSQYLRYVPQRWLALAPSPDGSGLPGQSDFANLYINLRRAAEVVGWSLTEAVGGLISVMADGTDGSHYLYAGLASPPMPQPTGTRVIDGGCYHAVAPDSPCPGCLSFDRCDECARFGRKRDASDTFEWAAYENDRPNLWDNTVMMDELAQPYPTGMWSDYTKRKIAERENGGAADTDVAGGAANSCSRPGKPAHSISPTVRPRLMPHEVRLPIGMTACVMPAGVYLCYQCDEGDQTGAYQRIMGLAANLDRRTFTVEEERAASKASPIVMERNIQPEKGPFSDPFATGRAAGDPLMEGWFHDAEHDVLRKLELPLGMALAPEDGFCIVCSTIPAVNRNDPTRYEIQLLVDASKITPPRPGS